MFYFIIFLIMSIIILYTYDRKKDYFSNHEYSKNYPYNPIIKTPQTNYLDISNKLKNQDKYKYEISVALAPTPTVQCDKLKNKSDCNSNGCNWFGTYCSAMYPSYL